MYTYQRHLTYHRHTYHTDLTYHRHTYHRQHLTYHLDFSHPIAKYVKRSENNNLVQAWKREPDKPKSSLNYVMAKTF